MLASAVPTSDQERIVALTSANEAFNRGQAQKSLDPESAKQAFQEAADGFQSLIDSGIHNGRLFYNLANAQFQLGELGHAVANYRRAQRLIPGDPNLAVNLRFARSQCRSQIPVASSRSALETFFFWHYQTSTRARFRIGVTAYLLFWLVLMLRVFLPRYRWSTLALPLLLGWIVLGSSVSLELIGRIRNPEGVLVADDVLIRRGDGESYEPQFKETFHEGVELMILETRGDWTRIRLTDGNQGWVPTKTVERI